MDLNKIHEPRGGGLAMNLEERLADLEARVAALEACVDCDQVPPCPREGQPAPARSCETCALSAMSVALGDENPCPPTECDDCEEAGWLINWRPAPQPCTCMTDRLPGTLGHLPSCPAYPTPAPQPRGGGR